MIIALIGMILAADPTTAATPAAVQASPAAVVPTKAKPKKICKTDDADSGTRMAKRVCRTAEEWNQLPQLGTGRSGFSISGESMQSH